MVVAGKGISEFKIGDTKSAVVAYFGQPASDADGYLRYPEQGIELLLQDDKVDAIFFFFRHPGSKAFRGVTDTGIGEASTVDEVIKIYGRPSRPSESIVSEFGEVPGAREKRLAYNGISFTFWNDELADIRVYPKSTAKAE